MSFRDTLYKFEHVENASPVNHLLPGKNQYFFGTPHYIQSTAQYKMDSLWTEVTADNTHGTWPTFDELRGVFQSDLSSVFDTAGDALPTLNGKVKRKYIHAVASHGKVALHSSGNHPFTGVFKGADLGIIRPSTTAEPKLNDPDFPLGPGFALKFLRDGRDSANTVAMFNIGG